MNFIEKKVIELTFGRVISDFGIIFEDNYYFSNRKQRLVKCAKNGSHFFVLSFSDHLNKIPLLLSMHNYKLSLGDLEKLRAVIDSFLKNSDTTHESLEFSDSTYLMCRYRLSLLKSANHDQTYYILRATEQSKTSALFGVSIMNYKLSAENVRSIRRMIDAILLA